MVKCDGRFWWGLVLGLVVCGATAGAAEYVVAPEGLDTNPGTMEAPFATMQRGQQAAVPGDTVFFRGGTYALTEDQIARYQSIWAYVSYLDKSGVPGSPIRYWAYPGERPVFDCSRITPPNLRVTAFQVVGDWLHFKGLEVTGVQVTILTHTQSECFENQGSNNIFEQLSLHDNQAIGVYCVRGANNLILNCDAYRNWDTTSENGRGGNVDGFGGHLRNRGDTNNVFRGCRAWFNSDDGYDAINSDTPVVFENCWAFYNGFSTSFERLGDGNGFKSGGHAGTPVGSLPDPIPRHITRFCLAVGNKANGFYANHHIGALTWQNNTAIRNPNNFNLLCRLSDNATDVPGYDQDMKNNLGVLGGNEVVNLAATGNNVDHNYFSLPVTITADDFVSLDESLLTQPRQANGDLPAIAFARLAPGSDAIDRGTSIGFAYEGGAPDLGAFESGQDDAPAIETLAASPVEGVVMTASNPREVRAGGHPRDWGRSFTMALGVCRGPCPAGESNRRRRHAPPSSVLPRTCHLHFGAQSGSFVDNVAGGICGERRFLQRQPWGGEV